MATLAAALPLLSVRITAGPIELRGVADDLIMPLAELASAGIHAPDFMPFYTPWSLTPPEEMPRSMGQYHWGQRAGFSVAAWGADFAVFYDGELVGSQGISTRDYLITRTGETGSWLGRRYQGNGNGGRAAGCSCRRQDRLAEMFDLTAARATVESNIYLILMVMW